MDSARQVIRWSMPGWVFLFWLGVFQIIQNVCVFGSFAAAMEHSALTQLSAGSAAVMIGSGVPLGFLIYQLYYHVYDRWMPFSFAPQDRGGEILRGLPGDVQARLRAYEPELSSNDMSETTNIRLLSYVLGPRVPRLKAEFRNRQGKDDYRRNRLVNFEVIRFYLHVICAEIESDNFRQEYTSLSDIYHAIGASRTALICSFAAYVSYNSMSPVHRAALFAPNLYPVLINGAICTLALKVLQSRRTRTGIASQAILAHTTNWYAREKKDAGAAGAKDSTLL